MLGRMGWWLGRTPNTAASALRKVLNRKLRPFGSFMVESVRLDLDNFEWQMQFCTSSTRFSSSVVQGFFSVGFFFVVVGFVVVVLVGFFVCLLVFQ